MVNWFINMFVKTSITLGAIATVPTPPSTPYTPSRPEVPYPDTPAAPTPLSPDTPMPNIPEQPLPGTPAEPHPPLPPESSFGQALNEIIEESPPEKRTRSETRIRKKKERNYIPFQGRRPTERLPLPQAQQDEGILMNHPQPQINPGPPVNSLPPTDRYN